MREVNLKIHDSGLVLLANPLRKPDEDRSHIQIFDVPDDVPPAAVAKQFTRVAVWPWSARLSWSQIAGLSQGALVRTDVA